MNRRDSLILSSLLALGVTVGLALTPTVWLQKLDLKTWDYRLRQLAEPPEDDSPIQLVVIDEESVRWGEDRDFGEFPRWSREVYEMVLDFCGQARAVIFALNMAEEDELGGDPSFASFMDRSDSAAAILGLMTSGVAGAGPAVRWPNGLKNAFSFDGSSEPTRRALFTKPFATFPPMILAESASALGHFLFPGDADDVVRRLQPFVLFDDQAVPFLGLAAYGATEGATKERQPRTPLLRLEGRHLSFGGRRVPLDDDGNMALRPRKLESGQPYRFASTNISRVVDSYFQLKRDETPDLDPGVFKDRYVFVGRTQWQEEFTHVDSMTGLEMTATLLDNFLAKDFIHPLPNRNRYLLIGMLALAGVASTVFIHRAWLAATAVAAWVAVPWIIAWLAYPRGHFWPVVEPTVAVLLAGLGGWGIRHARSRAEETPSQQLPKEVQAPRLAHSSDGKTFDVFLSHNSKNKPTVRELADALEARGLRVWLDERELVPGRPWQDALEEIIRTVKSAAVLVGEDGLGPWEMTEMRGCLSEFVDRDAPAIPVLLPGATKQPELPLFLKQMRWVDLRDGLTEEGLDLLEWGVTGVKPGSR